MKSKVKPILDSQLSGLDWTPEDSLNMLRLMRGEPQMKKKLSWALVMALAITLIAVSALAVTLWKNYYDKMAHNEGQIGYFDSWNGDKRAEFVLAMQEEGIEFDKASINKLASKDTSDADKAKIATDLILNRYPGMREDTITTLSIMEAEKGPMHTWSLADKAMYTQLLVKSGTLRADEEMFWTPGKDDIPQEKALSIAQEAVMEKFGETEESLKKYQVFAELRSRADQRDERKWLVYYVDPQQEGTPQYDVWMDGKTGELEEVWSPAQKVEEAKKNAPPAHISQMWDEAIVAFREAEPYTTDSLMGLRAQWADKFAEMKQHTTHWGGMYNTIKNLMEQDIRLPEDGAISSEQAWEKAETAVLALPGWTREKLDMFGRLAEVYYFSRELDKPVYHLFYTQKRHYWPEFDGMPSDHYEKDYLLPLYALYGGDSTDVPHYAAIRLDAKTGELTEAPVVGQYQKGVPIVPEFELIK